MDEYTRFAFSKTCKGCSDLEKKYKSFYCKEEFFNEKDNNDRPINCINYYYGKIQRR